MKTTQRFSKLAEEISALLVLQGDKSGDSAFYHAVSQAMARAQGPFEIALDSLRGSFSGDRLAGLLSEAAVFTETGQWPLHAELKTQVPAGLLELARLPALGAAGAKAVFDTFDATSMAETELLCREKRLSKAGLFDDRRENEILAQIQNRGRGEPRFLLSEALLEASLLADLLKKKTGIPVEVAGSLRRVCPLVSDLDLLAILPEASSPGDIIKEVEAYPGVKAGAMENTGPWPVLHFTLKNGMPCKLYFAAEKGGAFARRFLTGSRQHNTQLAEFATERGFELTPAGLAKNGTAIGCADESGIFHALGLEFIPPELREGRGEIEAASRRSLPELVVRAQLKGLFHCHSRYSDGSNTLEEMVAAAQAMGLEYIGIAEHSATAQYVKGLAPESVLEQFRAIDGLQKKFKIKIFKGVESEIKKDGGLDYDEELLKKFDFVIGSIHTDLEMIEERMTERILKALANPYLDFLGHLTNRYLLLRESADVDVPRVIDAAARHGVVMEINGNPRRLEIEWQYGTLMKEKGVLAAINPDAHSVAALNDIDYGLAVARKGWLEPANILNTSPADRILKSLRRNPGTG